MNIEILVVILVVVAASVYAIWRIICALRSTGDPCYGCEGCALKDIKCGNQKKDCEKFGRKK
jgi:hypothetical protein